MSGPYSKTSTQIKQERILNLTTALSTFIVRDASHPSLQARQHRRNAIIQAMVTAANDKVRSYAVLESHSMNSAATTILLDQALEFIEAAHTLIEGWNRADVKSGLTVVR